MPASHSLTILHVTAPGAAGGLESVVLELVGGHHRLGHRTVLATIVAPGNPDHPVARRAVELGVEVMPLAIPPRSYIAEYRAIRGAIADINPDVIHTHGYRADILGGLAARRFGCPWVSTAHGFTGGDAKNRLYEWLQVRAYRRAQAVIAVSRPIARRLEQGGVLPARVALIPNAIGPKPMLERAAARRLLGLPDTECVIGWVGRLSNEKGADVFLDALAQLGAPSWVASVVGDGPERQALQAQARSLGIGDRVRWHGMVENASALFPAFDLFVLSSHTEGTPMTLLEAALAGVPIVSTNVGGVPDVFTREEVALVPAGQPSALSSEMRSLIANPAQGRTRSLAASQAVSERFDLGRWLERHLALYRRIAESEGPPA